MGLGSESQQESKSGRVLPLPDPVEIEGPGEPFERETKGHEGLDREGREDICLDIDPGSIPSIL